MFATSVPGPPSAPPPARGATAAGLVLAGVGVDRVAADLVPGALIDTAFSTGLGAPFAGSGFGASAAWGSLVTTPTAGAPGGAAISSTRYIGGSATPPPLDRATTRSEIATRCSAADMASGPAMLERAPLRITAARSPVR